ncbi:hypothetical protein [Streptomyces sp. NPDC003015]
MRTPAPASAELSTRASPPLAPVTVSPSASPVVSLAARSRAARRARRASSAGPGVMTTS